MTERLFYNLPVTSADPGERLTICRYFDRKVILRRLVMPTVTMRAFVAIRLSIGSSSATSERVFYEGRSEARLSWMWLEESLLVALPRVDKGHDVTLIVENTSTERTAFGGTYLAEASS